MNPAEIYAKMKLLKHAIDTAVRQAEQDAMEYAEQTRARTLETDHGTVSLARRRPSARLDEQGFLQWVKENHPTEVVESVRPAYAETFRKSLRIVGEDVLTAEGEVLDFASVADGVVYLSTRLTDHDKTEAVEYVAANLESLLRREVTRG